jgi:hypothetical protein
VSIPVNISDIPQVTRTELTMTTGLDTDEPDILVLDKVVERSDGIASTSDTRNDGIWQSTNSLCKLRLDFPSDDSLEVADNGGEGVRSDSRSNEEVRRVERGNPLAHGLVDGVLQCSRSRSDGHDLGISVRRSSVKQDQPTSPPSILILKTLSSCLRTSSAPMKMVHFMPKRAQTVAVATPCCPAPVSAMMRDLPNLFASRIYGVSTRL